MQTYPRHVRQINVPIDRAIFNKYQDSMVRRHEIHGDEFVTLYDNTFNDGVNVTVVLYTVIDLFVRVDVHHPNGQSYSSDIHSLNGSAELDFYSVTYMINLLPQL